MIDSEQSQEYYNLPTVTDSGKVVAIGNEQTVWKSNREKRVTIGIAVLLLIAIFGAVTIYAIAQSPSDGGKRATEKSQENSLLQVEAPEAMVNPVEQETLFKQSFVTATNKATEVAVGETSIISKAESSQTDIIDEEGNYQAYIPTTYDLRTKASALSCNFAPIDEQLCVGGNWSNIIASTISNTLCMQSTNFVETKLSGQYLLSCANFKDKCDELLTLQEFESALLLLKTQGIPKASCMEYDGLKYDVEPNICSETCTDGTPISLTKYAFTDLWDINDNMTTTVQNVKQHIYQRGPVIAILEHSAAITRYAGSQQNGVFVNSPSNNPSFGLRAFKVVGWDLAPTSSQPVLYWIMQNTFSSAWGLNGYIRIRANDPIVEGYYGLSL